MPLLLESTPVLGWLVPSAFFDILQNYSETYLLPYWVGAAMVVLTERPVQGIFKDISLSCLIPN